MTLYLANKVGEHVELPVAVASKLFMMVANVDTIARMTAETQHASNLSSASITLGNATQQPTDDAEQEGSNADTVPLQLRDLDYSKKVLDAVVNYATLPDNKRTANIPKPLTRPLFQLVQEHELNLVREAEEKQFLVQLLDIASYLRFEQLVALCAAYMCERIDAIAKEAPDIMTGSERIREFLHMENEWTPEEMGHLRREMEYAKQMDPKLY